MRLGKSIFALIPALALSCVENRLPEPVFVPEITALEAEGAKSVTISAANSSVILEMEEISDLGAVRITSCDFNDNSVVKPSVPLVGTFNLKEPLSIILKTYAEYRWNIIASQTISREFSLRGQVGPTVFDEANRRVLVKLSKSTPLTWTEVKKCKLGPEGQTSYSEDPFLWRDFSDVHSLTVSYRDIREEWRIYVEQSDIAVELTDVSPRVSSCYLRSAAPEGADNGFVYRLAGTQEWQEVDSLILSSGNVVGVIDGLQALTDYECIAFSGKDSTDIYEFRTLEAVQLPNNSLDVVSKAESNNYYSFFDPKSAIEGCNAKWWDSGNVGSTTIGESYAITVPDPDDKKHGDYSAKLISRFVIVKFAAGNLFCGSFAGLVGTSGGKVHFGRPFTARPKALRLWLKYENGPIDNFNGAPAGDPVKAGDPDKGQVFIALGDWDWKVYGGTQESPVLVNTTDKSTVFNPGDPSVIAYGTFITDKPTGGWTEIDIPLDYRDNFRKPTHIIISCASSYLGDYFTGSTSSRMWVDDFRLIY